MVSIFLLLSPRIGGTLWWLARPALWQAAFSSWTWPLFGLVFLPWTTLTYVWVFQGGVIGPEWLLIALAVAVDFASYFGSAYGSSNRSIEIKPYYNPS